MTDELRNPEKLAWLVQKEKAKAFSEKLPEEHGEIYYLVAIDKNGIMVRRNFELKEAAISEARDFWVNKGFLAVEVFRFVSQGTNLLLETVYHGLRNF